MVGLGLGLGLGLVVGLVVGLGSYGEYVITLGGELLQERHRCQTAAVNVTI